MTKYIILSSIILLGTLWFVLNMLGRRNVIDLQNEPRDIDVQASSKLDGGEVTLGAQFVIPEDKYITVTSADGGPLFKIQKTQNQVLLGYIKHLYDFRDAEEKRSGKTSFRSTYAGYDVASLIDPKSDTPSPLKDFFMKNTVVLQSSGTGDLPIVTVFYIDGNAYALYSSPEGPNGENIQSGKFIIVNYTKEMSERIGASVSGVQSAVVDWTASGYELTSSVNPPIYYIQRIYRSTSENKIKVSVKTYLKSKSQYELQIDPQTLKVVDVVELE